MPAANAVSWAISTILPAWLAEMVLAWVGPDASPAWLGGLPGDALRQLPFVGVAAFLILHQFRMARATAVSIRGNLSAVTAVLFGTPIMVVGGFVVALLVALLVMMLVMILAGGVSLLLPPVHDFFLGWWWTLEAIIRKFGYLLFVFPACFVGAAVILWIHCWSLSLWMPDPAVVGRIAARWTLFAGSVAATITLHHGFLGRFPSAEDPALLALFMMVWFGPLLSASRRGAEGSAKRPDLPPA